MVGDVGWDGGVINHPSFATVALPVGQALTEAWFYLLPMPLAYNLLTPPLKRKLGSTY